MKKIILTLVLGLTVNAWCAQPLKVTESPITAQSWIVADGNGNKLSSANMDEVRSIASITKLMAVIVVLDSGALLHEEVTSLYGSQLTRLQLIDLAMIHSDNRAAQLLCDTYPGGGAKCIDDMNKRALELGMLSTRYTEPTGLLNTNVSTASDLLKLVKVAQNYPQIVDASNRASVSIETQYRSGKTQKSRTLTFPNTNSLVRSGFQFLVSKTGFIAKSGGCIVMTMITPNGVRTVILLGSKNMTTRITEASRLANMY